MIFFFYLKNFGAGAGTGTFLLKKNSEIIFQNRKKFFRCFSKIKFKITYNLPICRTKVKDKSKRIQILNFMYLYIHQRKTAQELRMIFSPFKNHPPFHIHLKILCTRQRKTAQELSMNFSPFKNHPSFHFHLKILCTRQRKKAQELRMIFSPFKNHQSFHFHLKISCTRQRKKAQELSMNFSPFKNHPSFHFHLKTLCKIEKNRRRNLEGFFLLLKNTPRSNVISNSQRKTAQELSMIFFRSKISSCHDDHSKKTCTRRPKIYPSFD